MSQSLIAGSPMITVTVTTHCPPHANFHVIIVFNLLLVLLTALAASSIQMHFESTLLKVLG